jgi:hypothetical protein
MRHNFGWDDTGQDQTGRAGGPSIMQSTEEWMARISSIRENHQTKV